MCYEFARTCDDPILAKIESTARTHYFLVCIGYLNYLYTSEQAITAKISKLLFVEKIVLHGLDEKEMADILLFPATKEFQILHGNKELYHAFIVRNTKQTT